MAAQGFLIPLVLVRTQAGQPKAAQWGRCGCSAEKQRGSRKTAAGRRRGRDDGLPPSFFTRYPPQDVVEVKWRFWLLLTAFAFARFIEVVPILRDRVKNSPGPVALGSRRGTAPFCWLAAGAYAALLI